MKLRFFIAAAVFIFIAVAVFSSAHGVDGVCSDLECLLNEFCLRSDTDPSGSEDVFTAFCREYYSKRRFLYSVCFKTELRHIDNLINDIYSGLGSGTCTEQILCLAGELRRSLHDIKSFQTGDFKNVL